MTEDEAILSRAAAWLDEGLGVAIATVVATWSSAPRAAGSQMAVNERGEFVGSVSGGCVESAVIEEALGILRDGRPRLLTFGVDQGRAWEVGLACGGTIQVHVDRARRETLDRLRSAMAAGRSVALVVGLEAGDGRVVDPGSPEPTTPPEIAVAVRDALARDQAVQVEVDGRTHLVRPFAPPVRLAIVGAVHVTQVLAPMASLAGLEPAVVDPRPGYATPARFPGVRLVQAWPEEGLARIGLGPRTAVVALTHDPKLDDPALLAALRSPAFYVGALGSRRTHAARRARLAAAGIGDADLARVHGPVGLSIGARGPAEIAVSILAEVVQVLRRPAGS